MASLAFLSPKAAPQAVGVPVHGPAAVASTAVHGGQAQSAGQSSSHAAQAATLMGSVVGSLTAVRAAYHARRGRGQKQGSSAVVVCAAAEPSQLEVLEKYVKERGGDKVLRKILIANNGMAAAKAILSMRQWAYLELGLDSVLEFVVMATPEDLDANAEFIRLADSYVEVPGGKNVNNYANVDLICEVAKNNKVDAVWPGWGHASENPALPDGLSKLGITFIGPRAPVMSVLGDKIAANILAQTAGVPSIPWSGDGLKAELTAEGTIPDDIFKKGCIASLDEALACAQRIGYPIMLKASEGGGGKGIRMCHSDDDIRQNYPQVIAEAPPGSPVFIMQLCSGARHIEVQIVGDLHGKAIALNGRDCSTQRRFQKIFEEGPPVIVPKDTFKEMERAAQRLTQSIGYTGAGTVEYLFNAAENKFYFLELNPRLQVEHPVTEELTNVNLPATQLQCLMGIPLENQTQIRRFYGKHVDDLSDGIDFLAEDYIYPQKHVIAARITAENPDDGFKPTSGRINRIKFQSSVSCWGYFSVGANGSVHEYADSQFGHIFAHGNNREEARKALALSLKNMNVVGEIRNPVEYLVELANMEAFRENTIDTSWLDGLIKEKTVELKYDAFDVVFYAAVFRAMELLKTRSAEIVDNLTKSQLGPIQQIASLNEFPIEITFEGNKYTFQVQRAGPDLLNMTIGGKMIPAKVREQSDGQLFVTVGESVMNVFGTEEPLGLRLRLEGIATVMLPTIYDPSELRSEFNGKVVRYLQDSGAQVKEGEPYVELEAMKMIMPVKASATGAITHTCATGSIVSAGQLLGSLELADPSSVQKIVPFKGDFALKAASGAEGEEDVKTKLDMLLAGYASSGQPSELVQSLFAQTPAADIPEVTCNLIESYLVVEETYAKLMTEGNLKGHDQLCLALISQNKDSLDTVVKLELAHSRLAVRNQVILAVLRDLLLGSIPGTEQLLGCLSRLAELPSWGGYAEVVLLARQVKEKESVPPYEDRMTEVRNMLEQEGAALDLLSSFPARKSGVELLLANVGDANETIRKNALQVYVKRVYRSYTPTELSITDNGASNLSLLWKYRHPNVFGGAQVPQREGYCAVVPAVSDVESVLKGALPLDGSAGAVNTIEVIVGPNAFPSALSFDNTDEAVTAAVAQMEGWLSAAADSLKKAGVYKVVLTQAQVPLLPRHTCYMADNGWKEVTARRDMRATHAHLLDISYLSSDYELEQINPTIGRNAHVLLGTKKGEQAKGKRGPAKTLFARLITNTLKHDGSFDGDEWMAWPETLLLSALDELEHARLNPKVGTQPGSNVFAHFVSLVDLSPEQASLKFEMFMNRFVSRYGQRMQNMKVDEIVVKVGIGSVAGGRTHTLRVSASSATGEYLRIGSLLESEDPVTGQIAKWIDVKTGENVSTDTFSTSKLDAKRRTARAAGSTYAPEFLGMMKMDLISRWSSHSEAMGGGVEIPADVFEDTELVLNADGVLEESDRSPGVNDIGMVAWKVMMRTPEYVDGREIVVIANDVTYQAGSFGVAEDVFFQKASEYARERGLPRVFISCNSGARVGLVEELKPYVKVKWTDESNPSKGFEYLYLEEEDYKRFPEGTVVARETVDCGRPIYALEGIIGSGQKSTAGGIGVENLQGSALIAGETSRAYNEIFTLSYITGRSVGIGAYLNRLGQRTIQMVNGPMILTGFGALNKLLGRKVYQSQDQLGGPQVMVPNGVTHQLVQSDQEGVGAILDWLSFVPKDCWSGPAVIKSADPVERDITFVPTKLPYDPRHMLAGTTTPEGTKLSGFFDEGTFKEYLPGWGKSVVVGRAKLGGIPMGVIAVETRSVSRIVPADPANPLSQEVVEPQAGQVWFPDSAHKTATAIRDMNRGENLPLIIFANWRGFSGGTRDMYQEVLKFGAQIVDALVDYKHPVFVYIPPGGELRGGAWVVIDPAINPEQMEMYADVESRGGILEPAGIVEVKFREKQQMDMMTRLDPELKKLNEELDNSGVMGESADAVKAKIKEREEKLLPLYTQVACEFADLHDRTGRMEAKGVIRGALEFKRSREFFYWRVRRRLLEQELVKNLCQADASLSTKGVQELLDSWLPGDDDRTIVAYLQKNSVADKIESVRVAAVKRQIQELTEQLPESERV